jgi:GNAT superfamily N-acetyltransferase
LHKAAEQWVGVWEGNIVAHTGVIQFPLRKGWKRVHRLVVLPDFQGIGIGTRFITEVAREYIKRGKNMSLITTTPALVHALKKHKNWPLVRYGRIKSTMDKMNSKYGLDNKHLGDKNSTGRITYSFEFVKD